MAMVRRDTKLCRNNTTYYKGPWKWYDNEWLDIFHVKIHLFFLLELSNFAFNHCIGVNEFQMFFSYFQAWKWACGSGLLRSKRRSESVNSVCSALNNADYSEQFGPPRIVRSLPNCWLYNVETSFIKTRAEHSRSRMRRKRLNKMFRRAFNPPNQLI